MPKDSPPRKPPAGKAKGKGKAPAKSAGGFNKKVGGLPVWAWGALVLAAVGIGLYIRKRSGATASVPSDSATPTEPGGGGGPGAGGEDLSGLTGAIEDLVKALGSGNPPGGDGGGDGGGGGGGGHKEHQHRVRHHETPISRRQARLRERRIRQRAHERSVVHHHISKPQIHVRHTGHGISHHPPAAAIHVHRPIRHHVGGLHPPSPRHNVEGERRHEHEQRQEHHHRRHHHR